MKPTIYLETTIVSYLTARLSRDLVTAAHQQITHEWWANRRGDFDLYVSQLVVQEAGAGDKLMAMRRLEELRTIPLLDVSDAAGALARRLINDKTLPAKAALDALHIAVATVHGIDYLLTWNCKHIANAEMQNKMAAACRASGYEPPIICTPEELSGS